MHPALVGAAGSTRLDLGQALYELGMITMPDLLSPASPALFWAWLRYYLAPTLHDDLRIGVDFADLDPHQKGILSDDFGVALGTHWLRKHLGPFTHVVDGRRFANHFGRYQSRKLKSKAKVGPSKAPDFVMRDTAGKWHILECKGTQSGRGEQRRMLKVALAQKQAIQLKGTVKGEQLASALCLGDEGGLVGSHLLVVDPEDDEPLISLDGRNAEEMEEAADVLTVARALGAVGLNDIAVEMSLSADASPDLPFLLPSERFRLRSSRADRLRGAAERTAERQLVKFEHRGEDYEGRIAEIVLPPTSRSFPYRSVVIRQGVPTSLVEEVSDADLLLSDRSRDRARKFAADKSLRVVSEKNLSSIEVGSVFYSDMEWFE